MSSFDVNVDVNTEATSKFIKLRTSSSQYCIINIADIVSVITRFSNGTFKTEIMLRNNGTILVDDSVEDIWKKIGV